LSLENGDEYTPVWRIVPVDTLPWAHNPSRCRWKHEFAASGLGSFGDFVATLSDEQIAECSYHCRTDWATAARIAVQLVEAGTISEEDVDAAVEGRDACIAWGVSSFFFEEPIFVSGDKLGAGQHRVCAMKVAGVPYCPVRD
jgi:hypothetical protein